MRLRTNRLVPSNSRMNKVFRLFPGIHGNEPHLRFRYGKTNKNTRLDAGVSIMQSDITL